MSKALIFTAFLTPCRGSAYAVEIGVKQKIALRFADGVKNDRHGIGGRVLDIALVLPELPLHGLEDGAVQIPQAGAHIGLGQDSLPDPIFLGIKLHAALHACTTMNENQVQQAGQHGKI